ncbi:MAG: hypothetical protein EHM67_05675 [Hyphomicrobiaceae bacterium]|nr:MAG: hypothetical protein EHM67_05675 [Hyphomicrobiaceae bacterium]
MRLRRQSGGSLLLIGQQEEPAMALMAGAMISVAAQLPAQGASFYILDGSPADSPLARVLPDVQAAIPQPVRFVEYRAVSEAMNELAGELKRRQSAAEPVTAPLFVIVYGLQRYRALRKSEDFSFAARDQEAGQAADRVYADLLREGPPVGMHVLAWADTAACIERTLDRASLREFDHRVLFQMSASDSSNLIDSPMANKLGMNRALAFSEEQGTLEKFRPYALPSPEWLEHVRTCLAAQHK